MTVTGQTNPQAWAVGAEDHRHIAGEIHRANGVRVVMNVRRVQPRFAAAVAYPFRFRANQAHARAAGVKMYLPLGGKKVAI